MKILELESIHRSYDRGVEVLAGVDLALEPGEVVGLLGANGAGKTTLVRIAMGLLLPQRGKVHVLGLEHADDAVEIKRRVGYVSEDQILPGFLRVGDVVELHRTLFPSWDPQLERRLAERFELSKRMKVAKLSKGQARQVAVLCAVAHRPELLILDEPAGGLDPAARREFLEVAIDALVDGGSTILFSSHHMSDVERIAGRIVLLHRGRVLIDRELDALREEVSLAVMTPQNGTTLERVRALEGCLAARVHAGELRAVFAQPLEAVRGRLAAELGARDAVCTRLDLEDLFVETVEGQRR
jgi:ABC-2 type transport system ATP-binding protein